MKRLLILGGTGEAAALHEAAVHNFEGRLAVVSSLAGRTETPRALPGTVRRGGFGGADGLARWLREERMDMLVDATHPYAARVSRNARLACEAAEIDRSVLWRPPWVAGPGDNWIAARDAAEAAALLPRFGRRAFLALGSGQLASFAGTPDVWTMWRVAEAPPPGAPADLVIVGRGPFGVEDELRLMVEQDIDVVVSRNSGGEATLGKIVAARRRGIPVIMLERPAPEPGEKFSELKEVVQWIEQRLD